MVYISNIPKISFKSSMPIYHVYNTNHDGTVCDLPAEKTTEPVKALERRICLEGSPECCLFQKYVPDFQDNAYAKSTYIGRHNNIKRILVLGEDATNMKTDRYNFYGKNQGSEEDLIKKIKGYVKKKTFLPNSYTQIGLVLYTKSKFVKIKKEIKERFKLEKIHIVDSSGKIITVLNNLSKNTGKKIRTQRANRQTTEKLSKKELRDKAYREALLEEEQNRKDLETYLKSIERKKKREEKRTTQKLEQVNPFAQYIEGRPEELEEEFEDTDRYLDSFVTPTDKPKLVQGDLFEGIA